MPGHKGFKLQQLVNFQKFSTVRVNISKLWKPITWEKKQLNRKMSSFLLSNLCYWCLECVWIDYVWVVLLARLHLVLGHGYCYTIVTMPGLTTVNEFLFWDNTNTQQACITIEPWENKSQETAIFLWINPWCITNFTGSVDLVIKWGRELLTRFSQGETWLLDWGCQWAGGHQTLGFFLW